MRGSLGLTLAQMEQLWLDWAGCALRLAQAADQRYADVDCRGAAVRDDLPGAPPTLQAQSCVQCNCARRGLPSRSHPCGRYGVERKVTAGTPPAIEPIGMNRRNCLRTNSFQKHFLWCMIKICNFISQSIVFAMKSGLTSTATRGPRCKLTSN